jgi:hypothetical protein
MLASLLLPGLARSGPAGRGLARVVHCGQTWSARPRCFPGCLVPIRAGHRHEPQPRRRLTRWPGCPGRPRPDGRAAAGVAKSVISSHFADKNELMRELIRTAVATFTEFMEPRLAAQASAAGKIGAYLAGSADYITTYRSLHLAVLEIALNARSPDGLPLVASMLRPRHPGQHQLTRNRPRLTTRDR